MNAKEELQVGPFKIRLSFENEGLKKEVMSVFKESWPAIKAYQRNFDSIDCCCDIFINESHYNDYIKNSLKRSSEHCYKAENRCLIYSSDYTLIKYFINAPSNYIGYIIPFIGNLTIFSPFLLRNNTIILHAAGVVYRNKGFIFAGPAGIGKTTICRILTHGGTYPLSDDRVIVCNEWDKFMVYPLWIFSQDGMDLSHEFLKNKFQPVPLKTIFFLEQSKEFALKELSFLDKISYISRNSFLLSGDISSSRDAFFPTVYNIAKNNKLYKLYYDKSDKIFSLLDTYYE